MSRLTVLSLAMSFTVVASPALAQRDEAALRLLDQAIAAHQPAGSPLRATIRFEGQAPYATQSLHALGPYELFPNNRKVAIDEVAGSSEYEEESGIAGLDFNFRIVNTPGEGFYHDKLMNNYRPFQTRPNAIATLLPHTRLKNIRENAQSLRVSAAGQGTPARITYSLADGSSGTLVLDPSTKLLTAFEGAPAPGIYGEEKLSVLYSGYRRLAGTAIPEGYVIRTNNPIVGTQENKARLVAAQEGVGADAFTRPQSAVRWDPDVRKAALTVETLAPDIHLINNVTDTRSQWSYNVLAVTFDDFVLVAEAPVSAAANEKVLAKIAELAPGKPVRYLVLSHHHDDHIAGIEPYVKRGITMLTTPDAASLLNKIEETRGASSGTPKMEPVRGRRVFADRRNEAHIYDVAPIPIRTRCWPSTCRGRASSIRSIS